jgi:hypothetical protein
MRLLGTSGHINSQLIAFGKPEGDFHYENDEGRSVLDVRFIRGCARAQR